MTSFPVTSDFVFDSERVPGEEHSAHATLSAESVTTKGHYAHRARTSLPTQRITAQPSGATTSRQPIRPRQYQMLKSARLSSSAADVLDLPHAGPSNSGRVSSAASFRSLEQERAGNFAHPNDQYRTYYATSPLAPRQAIRSPSRTPPLHSPDLARLQHAGAFRRPSHTQDSPDYDDYMRLVQGSPRAAIMSVKSRRRLSEQSFSSIHSLSSPASHATNFGTLIGSYEESLLSGRMSTMPSKPLYFDAELGVLGIGNCKASLRCPSHIKLKFPAHFYNLEGTAAEKEGKVSSSSPYVGTIDLESFYIDKLLDHEVVDSGLGNGARRCEALPVPTFPGYRVPAKGQVQLIIKNPNLTAVKTFLVPYDVSDMQAGTKTFVRQKCHFASDSTPTTSPSAKTVALDENGMPSNATEETPHSPTLTRASTPRRSQPSQCRDMLRHAVHLQFCAVAAPKGRRGRVRKQQGDPEGVDQPLAPPESLEQDQDVPKAPQIYLHKAIRVVFTARVLDKSEKSTVTTDTPRMSDAKGGANLFSTYHGPSEEWNEARRTFKARQQAERRSTRSRQWDEVEALADHMVGVANSDPNGERLDAQDPLVVPDGAYDATRHLNRNGEEEVQTYGGDAVCSSNGAESKPINIPGAASYRRQRHPFWPHRPHGLIDTNVSHTGADGQRSNVHAQSIGSDPLQRDGTALGPSRTRASTLNHTLAGDRGSSIANYYPNVAASRYDERALLEQFHSSLALRSQQPTPTLGASPVSSTSVGGSAASLRSASPSYVRSRPTSPSTHLPLAAGSGGRNTNSTVYHHLPTAATSTAVAMAMARTPSNGSLSGKATTSSNTTLRPGALASSRAAVDTTSLSHLNHQHMQPVTSRPGFLRHISASSALMTSHHQRAPIATPSTTQEKGAASSQPTPSSK